MDVVKALVDVIKAVAWPAVVLIAICMFRGQVRSLSASINARVSEANKIKLKIGTVALELAREISRTPAVRLNSGASQDTSEKFDETAKLYDELHVEDPEKHVAERHRLADELGRLAAVLRLRRPALAERNDEGALVALATLAINSPEVGDLELLRKIATTARFNFTRYRILLGLLPSLTRDPSNKKVLKSSKSILRDVEVSGNVSPSLQRLIDKTETLITSLEDAFA
jgi:hypothetical protein